MCGRLGDRLGGKVGEFVQTFADIYVRTRNTCLDKFKHTFPKHRLWLTYEPSKLVFYVFREFRAGSFCTLPHKKRTFVYLD